MCQSQSTPEASLHFNQPAFILPSIFSLIINTNNRAKVSKWISLWYLLSFKPHRSFISLHITTEVATLWFYWIFFLFCFPNCNMTQTHILVVTTMSTFQLCQGLSSCGCIRYLHNLTKSCSIRFFIFKFLNLPETFTLLFFIFEMDQPRLLHLTL